MARLTDEFLRGIRPQVFQDRTTTLSEVGRDIPIDSLRETVAGIRAETRATLEALPDSAFAEQPVAEGEEVWAAGQVVAHVANAFHSMTGQVRPLLGLEAGRQVTPRSMDEWPDRASALAILEELDVDTAAFFDALPENGDYSAAMSHARFGEMDSKGWLVLVAMHENDHLGQIRALGA